MIKYYCNKCKNLLDIRIGYTIQIKHLDKVNLIHLCQNCYRECNNLCSEDAKEPVTYVKAEREQKVSIPMDERLDELEQIIKRPANPKGKNSASSEKVDMRGVDIDEILNRMAEEEKVGKVSNKPIKESVQQAKEESHESADSNRITYEESKLDVMPTRLKEIYPTLNDELLAQPGSKSNVETIARAVLMFYYGEPQATIAHHLQVSSQNVYLWKKKFCCKSIADRNCLSTVNDPKVADVLKEYREIGTIQTSVKKHKITEEEAYAIIEYYSGIKVKR